MPAMSVKAYVLVQTEVSSSAVSSQINEVQGVESANDVSGPYDVIARVLAENLDELGRLVVSQIQSIEGVTRTLTCPIVEL